MCFCMCTRVHVSSSAPGAVSKPSQTPPLTRSPPPARDGLSWMLMSCDGCGANKCFWHSTGSYYRTRPNGLASALMSRQISQPQPLYQSHMLLMQGWASTPLTRCRKNSLWLLLSTKLLALPLFSFITFIRGFLTFATVWIFFYLWKNMEVSI